MKYDTKTIKRNKKLVFMMNFYLFIMNKHLFLLKI